MNDPIELVRQELRLRREIVTHELECLMDDGADAGAIDAKIEEWELIDARERDLERRIKDVLTG